jgi:hypothetical protein
MADDLSLALVAAGVATQQQLAEVAASGHEGGRRVLALIRLGVDELRLCASLASLGFGPVLDGVDLVHADPRLLSRMTRAVVERTTALPIRESPAGIVVAMADPTDALARAELEAVLGSAILPTAVLPSELVDAVSRLVPEAELLPTVPRPSSAAPFVLSQKRRSRHPSTAPPVPLMRRKVFVEEGRETQSYAPPPAEAPPAKGDTWSDLMEDASFDELLEAIAESDSTSSVYDHACRAAGLHGRGAVVFLVLRGPPRMLRGARVAGPARPESVSELHFPANASPAFAHAVVDGTAYLGPYGTYEVERVLRVTLGVGDLGRTFALQPIQVVGKTVAVICIDEPVRRAEDALQRLGRVTEWALARLMDLGGMG